MFDIKTETVSCYAFFDVDETLISMKSMFSFIKLYFFYYPNELLKNMFYRDLERLYKSNVSREIINSRYYEYFKYFPVESVERVCELWFKKYGFNQPTFYHKNIIDKLKKHQKNGVECVFISGSFNELIIYIANDLNVRKILSIHLEKETCEYTGRIIPPQTIGSGKAQALSLFLEQNQGNAHQSFAYGDDISDVPMLELVGFPRVVRGQKYLEAYAYDRNWKIINPY